MRTTADGVLRIEREQYRRDRELDRRIDAEDEKIQREAGTQNAEARIRRGEATQEENAAPAEAPRDAARDAGAELRAGGAPSDSDTTGRSPGANGPEE